MGCSIPARGYRRCTAAPSMGRCGCAAQPFRIPSCRASDDPRRGCAAAPHLLMAAIARAETRPALLAALRAIRPALNVIADEEGLKPFETDAFIAHRETPMLAVLPESEEQVRCVVVACRTLGVPLVSRGAGTGISGGAIPRRDGLLVVLSKMRRVLEVDALARTATVEAG